MSNVQRYDFKPKFLLRDWDGNCYIWDMKIISGYRLSITEFKILSNGADGGHYYLATDFLHEDKIRRVSVLFRSKEDENKLSQISSLIVEGELKEDSNGDVLLSDAVIISYK